MPKIINAANTILIGAGRSGTTSLYNYMLAHPQICFSDIKEVTYFSISEHYDRGNDYFHSFFSQFDKQPIIATSDTYLLIDKNAPERIARYNPDMKIIVMLRDPVQRAFSSFRYAVDNGYISQNENFIDTIGNEKNILKIDDIAAQNNLAHCYGSLYHKHLIFWTKYFPKKNFLLLKTNDLKNEPNMLFGELCNFLGLDRFYLDTAQRASNQASRPRIEHLHKILTDRNHLFRRFLRKVVPEKMKFMLMKSGVVDKIKNINRKKSPYLGIDSYAEKIAHEYFAADKKNLLRDFGLDL